MEGGTCPIAVGLTLRRLVAKCGEFCIAESIGAALDPLHPGCGTPSVCESVALTACSPACDLDFKSAFNSLHEGRQDP